MTNIATIAQAVGVVSACWAIVSGIGAWKREYIGKRQIELAEQTLAKFFEVKDAIAFIRNPFSDSSEGKTRQRGDHESTETSQLLDRGYIVIERYGKKESVFSEFNVLKYKFMASFGSDKESIFTDTNQALHKIFASARMLATHYWQRQGRVHMEGEEFQRHLDEMHRHEGIFWDVWSDNDQIRTELQGIQSRLEAATKHCFEEPVNTYQRFKRWWSKKFAA